MAYSEIFNEFVSLTLSTNSSGNACHPGFLFVCLFKSFLLFFFSKCCAWLTRRWTLKIFYQQCVMTVLDRGLLNLIYIPPDLRNLTLVCDIRFFLSWFCNRRFCVHWRPFLKYVHISCRVVISKLLTFWLNILLYLIKNNTSIDKDT